MPIYDFQCASCGHKAEIMRKISAASVELCPICQKETFAKQLSAPSFQLTGSGWYATDFKGGQKAGGQKVETQATESTPVETSPAPATCSISAASQ
ncbi:MAG: zinc ribbon domain-containing protein [Methylophilaceae bacterium]